MIDIITNALGARAMLFIIVILLLAFFGVSGMAAIQSARLDTAKAEKQTLTDQLQTLGKQVKAQNAAVDQMLANAAKAAERLKAAEAEAGQVEIITQERIEYIEHSQIPATCPEAVIWGATHAIEIGKRWEAAP